MTTDKKPVRREPTERDRRDEDAILREAERGPTLPDGEERPRPGPRAAKGMRSGAGDDLTRKGSRAEDR